MLFTINLRAIAQFYERVAEMRVHRTDDDHIVLEKGWFRLTVHQIPERYAKDIVITTPPFIRESSAIKLSFRVDSLSRARQVAAELGGLLYEPEHEWTYESTRVCSGYDPDGNVFQLSQPVGPESPGEDARA